MEVNLREPLWDLYATYLDEMLVGWSEKTFKSEKTRLKWIIEIMLSGVTSGPEIHKRLKELGYGDYTIKTMFIRGQHFYQYGLAKGIFRSQFNPFSDQMKRARRQFTQAYKKEHINLNFYDAEKRIHTISDSTVRDFCLALLKSGVRIDEAYKVDQASGTVIGKGMKERLTVFQYEGIKPNRNKVRVALTSIGLKPHTLRKLFARHLAMSDISRRDLMKVMGWSNWQTADSYFEPQENEALKQQVLNAMKR